MEIWGNFTPLLAVMSHFIKCRTIQNILPVTEKQLIENTKEFLLIQQIKHDTLHEYKKRRTISSLTALITVVKVHPAFEVQLSHGSWNTSGINFLSTHTVHRHRHRHTHTHTHTRLTSNQIKFVGVCRDCNFQGNVNEVPRNKSWFF